MWSSQPNGEEEVGEEYASEAQANEYENYEGGEETAEAYGEGEENGGEYYNGAGEENNEAAMKVEADGVGIYDDNGAAGQEEGAMDDVPEAEDISGSMEEEEADAANPEDAVVATIVNDVSDAMKFPSRLSALLRDQYDGYDATMRKSIQCAVLYEADRSLLSRYSSLRPFQRKIALFNTARDIVELLELPENAKAEILVNTIKRRDAMGPDVAWRRVAGVRKALKNEIAPDVVEFVVSEGMGVKDAMEAALDKKFVELELKKNEKKAQRPALWHFIASLYRNSFLTYQLYYDGGNGDVENPDLPPSEPPREVNVPDKKPDAVLKKGASVILKAIGNVSKIKRGKSSKPLTTEERRNKLVEVRKMMDSLGDYKEILTEEELTAQKTKLYGAMPPPPPSLVVEEGDAESAEDTDDEEDETLEEIQKKKKKETPKKVTPKKVTPKKATPKKATPNKAVKRGPYKKKGTPERKSKTPERKAKTKAMATAKEKVSPKKVRGPYKKKVVKKDPPKKGGKSKGKYKKTGKPRGRPAKTAAKKKVGTPVATIVVAKPVGRPRGRPRKSI